MAISDAFLAGFRSTSGFGEAFSRGYQSTLQRHFMRQQIRETRLLTDWLERALGPQPTGATPGPDEPVSPGERLDRTPPGTPPGTPTRSVTEAMRIAGLAGTPDPLPGKTAPENWRGALGWLKDTTGNAAQTAIANAPEAVGAAVRAVTSGIFGGPPPSFNPREALTPQELRFGGGQFGPLGLNAIRGGPLPGIWGGVPASRMEYSPIGQNPVLEAFINRWATNPIRYIDPRNAPPRADTRDLTAEEVEAIIQALSSGR